MPRSYLSPAQSSVKTRIMPASYSSKFVLPASAREEAARQSLRAVLMDHIHHQPSSSSNPSPLPWTGAPIQLQPATGDSITLLEQLKIFHQYTRLLAQACRDYRQQQHVPAHAVALSPRPTVYPKPLEWFEHLAGAFRGLDDAGRARIDQLLKLHASTVDSPAPARSPAKQAFELAKSLPHFDRDLTAYYLVFSQTLPATEYELEVAHSILRLHKPDSLTTLCQHLTTWRNQGLLHVLSVAAHNMPDLLDWNLPDSNDAQHIRHLLAHLRTDGYEQAIERFVAAFDPASPTDQAFLTILDKIAILMGVKSNAHDKTGHSLTQALASFPPLDAHIPNSTADAYACLKPALENAIPPSILRVDPVMASKRAKQGIEGTW